MLQFKYSWDKNKAESNLLKHGVSFDLARSIFTDPLAVTLFDEDHSENEERWITIGRAENTNLLLVVHTYLELNEEQIFVRIISARKPTKKEIHTYKEGEQ